MGGARAWHRHRHGPIVVRVKVVGRSGHLRVGLIVVRVVVCAKLDGRSSRCGRGRRSRLRGSGDGRTASDGRNHDRRFVLGIQLVLQCGYHRVAVVVIVVIVGCRARWSGGLGRRGLALGGGRRRLIIIVVQERVVAIGGERVEVEALDTSASLG